MKNISSSYPVADWDNYARIFASVTPSIQLDIYKEACLHLHGKVIDLGSGTAKIAPFLANEENIQSYMGVDYSQEMVVVARWILEKLERPMFQIQHNRIEEITGTVFTSGVSIQSYYSWPNPLETLRHIFNLLSSEGVFVLATPNKNLNTKLLHKVLKQELIAHPDFKAYTDYNLKLASNPQANFIGMNELIEQVQEVGFHVKECHQKHLCGGMNFLVLGKHS